jgi:hypothetical protein
MTMERNTETLSTRDLASPNEPAGGLTRSESDVPDAAAAEAQPGVRDQTVPAEEGTPLPAADDAQLPVDDAQLPVDERTAAAADEQTRLTAREQTAPSADERTGASARDQTVEATRPDASLDVDSGAPGHDNRPAVATQVVSTQEEDTRAAPPSTGGADSASNAGGSLLPAEMDATFLERWKEIQTRFVDEPRGAVEDADGLVANLMQQLAEGFAKERERLEAQWGRGEDISTEDLRVALQRYRTFFQRLLST